MNNEIKVIGNYSPSGYDASRIVDNSGIAPTVKENHGTVTATNVNNLRIRKLTPKECWRLMNFDDEDFEKAAKVNSNTQLYKQAGNSIVVACLEKIMNNMHLELEEIKLLELFGGIGACSKAMKRLGLDVTVADYVEIDKYACLSYNAINGTSFQPQDITTWDKDIDVNFIMHGSPCQDFSLAGLQKGGDFGSGTRSSLMYETLRIVQKLRPKYVIWENVKNLISKKHRHNFDNYLEFMESLGYTNYYQVLNAKDYGIPQNRERVFTVSILNGGNFEFPNKEQLDTRMQDVLEDSVEEKYYLSDKMIKYVSATGTANFSNHDSKINLDIARPLTTDQNKRAGTTNYISNNLPSNYDLSKHVGFEFPPKEELKLKLKDMLEENVDEKYYLSDTQIERIKTSTYNTSKTRIQEKDYCQTLCARDWKDPKCVEVNRKYGIFDDNKSKHQAGSVYDENGLAPTLDTMQGGWRQPCIEEYPTICETRYDEGIRTFKDNVCGSLRTIDACGNKCVIEEDKWSDLD